LKPIDTLTTSIYIQIQSDLARQKSLPTPHTKIKI